MKKTYETSDKAKEWAVHLRRFGKRMANRSTRRIARKLARQTSQQIADY